MSILRWMASLAIFLAPTFAARPVQGQFLEKLEEAVRAQLESAQRQSKPAESAESELSSSGVLPPPADAVEGQRGAPPKALPSILDAFQAVVPAPLELPAQQTTPANPGTYLGLEAEMAIGGGMGVRVASVAEGSPAWKAGFKVGDRIQAIDGFAVTDLDKMESRLSSVAPGKAVRFQVARAGRNLELSAVLLDADLAGRIASAAGPIPTRTQAQVDGPAWLGLQVNDLTTSFRQRFGISVFRGAAVTSVATGSPAASAGIRAGDAIIEIAGRPIENAEDLLAWMGQAQPGEVVQLRVARGVSVSTVNIGLGTEPGDKPPLRFGGRLAPEFPLSTTGLSSSPAKVDAVPPTKPAAPTEREQELERELEALRAELREANARLAETERKLSEIANALKRD